MKILKIFFLELLLITFMGENSLFAQYTGGSGSGWTAPSGLSGSPLPVVFTSFTAICMDQNIQLKWQTASEKDNDLFVIERSQDGKDWYVVDYVKGHGNTSSLSEYSYIDSKPFRMASYYRLKQTDFDGSFAYSKTVMVMLCSQDEMQNISIFPNPGSGIFRVEGIGRVSNLTVANSIGETILALKCTENLVEIDLTNHPAGIYFLHINKTTTKKIVLR